MLFIEESCEGSNTSSASRANPGQGGVSRAAVAYSGLGTEVLAELYRALKNQGFFRAASWLLGQLPPLLKVELVWQFCSAFGSSGRCSPGTGTCLVPLLQHPL